MDLDRCLFAIFFYNVHTYDTQRDDFTKRLLNPPYEIFPYPKNYLALAAARALVLADFFSATLTISMTTRPRYLPQLLQTL